MQNVTPSNSRSRSSDQADDSLLLIVWRQKGLIALITLLAVVAAGIYVFVTPKTYTAASRVLVQRAMPLSDKANLGQDVASETFLYQEAELFHSAPIISMALGGPQMDDLKILENVDRPMAFLKREVNVEVGKKDGLITVSLSSRYREDAKAIVDNVVDSYKAFKSKERREMASGVLGLLEKDKEKTDGLLAAKLDEMIQYKQTNNTLSFDGDKNNYIIQRANSLADALTNAHIDAINFKTAYDAAYKSVESDPDILKALKQATPVSLSAQDEELLKAEMFSRRQELAERKRIYLPDHPIIKTLEARINQLNVAYVSSAKVRWQAAEEREKELQSSFDQQQKLALDMGRKAAEYERLQKEVQQLQKHSDELDNRIKDVQLTLDAGAMNITVVEEANWEDQEVKPVARTVLVIAAALGILLGSFLAVAKEWLDPRLRSESEVKSAIGVPVLGAIPHLSGNTSPEALGWTVHLDPQSEAAEAYRAVRTSLQFGASDSDFRTIVITSPSSREGKSTLVSNLAIALAKGGKSVLVIDADFRTPSQHRIFGVSNEVGFANALESGEIAERAIRRTTIEGLHVMPSGPDVHDPSELLNSANLGELLDALAKRFDHVVVDTPAVLRLDDARIVAANCDVTLVILRADRSNRKLAEASRDRLLTVGARILGVVLNDGGGSGSGKSGNPSLLRGEGRVKDDMKAGDDALMHASARPISGSGRIS